MRTLKFYLPIFALLLSQGVITNAIAEEEIEELEDVQEVSGPKTFWTDAYPVLDRVVSLHLPQTTRKRSLRFIIDHRTNQAFTKNTFHDYFGFDGGGLKIGLAFRYGIIDHLDIGVMRQNDGGDQFDTYQFDAKYQFLHQEKHLIHAAARVGLSWFVQENAKDAIGVFGELLVSRIFFNRLTLGTGLLFHSNSTNEAKSNLDLPWSMAVPALAEIRILDWLAWNVEASFNVAGFGWKNHLQQQMFPIFSSAVKFITSRHSFSLVLTNNKYTTADGLVGNTVRDYDDLIIGFTITREWNF